MKAHPTIDIDDLVARCEDRLENGHRIFSDWEEDIRMLLIAVVELEDALIDEMRDRREILPETRSWGAWDDEMRV